MDKVIIGEDEDWGDRINEMFTRQSFPGKA